MLPHHEAVALLIRPLPMCSVCTLCLQVAPWKRIVLTRSVALAPTLLVALLAGKPNKLDVLNQWLNILQSIQLPFAVVPVRAHACLAVLRSHVRWTSTRSQHSLILLLKC
jgi:natural resistance-associated macrophage protein 2